MGLRLDDELIINVEAGSIVLVPVHLSMRYRREIDPASTFHWSSLRFTHEDLLWLT
jgi:hypothetical protein